MPPLHGRLAVRLTGNVLAATSLEPRQSAGSADAVAFSRILQVRDHPVPSHAHRRIRQATGCLPVPRKRTRLAPQKNERRRGPACLRTFLREAWAEACALEQRRNAFNGASGGVRCDHVNYVTATNPSVQ